MAIIVGVGLPVFTTRRFFHTEILVRRAAGIEAPADLKGKRVGVPEYQQTAALCRPLVQHGIAANRAVLETAAQYSHEQGLTPRPLRLEGVFAASMLEQ